MYCGSSLIRGSKDMVRWLLRWLVTCAFILAGTAFIGGLMGCVNDYNRIGAPIGGALVLIGLACFYVLEARNPTN